MSLRTTNALLKLFNLKLAHLRPQSLSYPRPSPFSTSASLLFWAATSWYVTSVFDLNPRAGVHGAECMLAKAMSGQNIILFILAIVSGLLYFVGRQVTEPITAQSRMRWWLARLTVGFSFSFLSLFSTVGAVAIGVGTFVVFRETVSGVQFLLLGLLAVGMGEGFRYQVFPGFLRLIPRLRTRALAKAFILIATSLGLLLLIEGLFFHTWQSDAPKVGACHLLVEFESPVAMQPK